ncbi:hypothetical protein BRD18_01950 [Halobacteriales archaeon SW_7_71_33]|nr:MAG: hypothetical protein BRD18_01950 [Halobacteriales archaeon SW_7_71_33]
MSENDGTDRRGLLKRTFGLVTLAAVAVGGFLGWQQITRPRVADFDVIRSEDAPDVYWAVVRNDGGPGGVRVYFRFRDEDNEVLLERTRDITMAGNGEQRLEFERNPTSVTDEYRFQVEPTDFPENQA